MLHRPGRALTVCIINDEAIALAFELTVDARKVAGRTLTVVRPDASAALPMCHVVYLAASAHNRAPGVIGDLGKGKLVLTVSDIPNFAETGGMVQLFVERWAHSYRRQRGRSTARTSD